MEIRKAERRQAKLRIGVSGTSGSGKTYSALLIAKGLASDWNKVLLIDTENGSGEMYSHLGEYNVLNLQAPFTPERYVEAIHAAEQAGMEVIVIDSTSHEWEGTGGCLEINERIAASKFRGNTWSAWSETTPRHRRFIEAILQSPCHIITTARSKSDVIQTEDKKIKKVGLKEIQREGFEYELTANFTLDRDGHYATASKDRTGLFIHKDPFVITEKVGEQLKKWNEGGSKPLPTPTLPPLPEFDYTKEKKLIMANLKSLGHKPKTADQAAEIVFELTNLELDPENYEEIISHLETLKNSEELSVPSILSPEEEAAINV